MAEPDANQGSSNAEGEPHLTLGLAAEWGRREEPWGGRRHQPKSHPYLGKQWEALLSSFMPLSHFWDAVWIQLPQGCHLGHLAIFRSSRRHPEQHQAGRGTQGPMQVAWSGAALHPHSRLFPAVEPARHRGRGSSPQISDPGGEPGTGFGPLSHIPHFWDESAAYFTS